MALLHTGPLPVRARWFLVAGRSRRRVVGWATFCMENEPVVCDKWYLSDKI